MIYCKFKVICSYCWRGCVIEYMYIYVIFNKRFVKIVFFMLEKFKVIVMFFVDFKIIKYLFYVSDNGYWFLFEVK